MTSESLTTSRGISSEDTPACWLDWRIHECHPFLRLFDKELELRHSRLFAYIHKGWILHHHTGKRAIKAASSVPVIEGADATPRGLLSPRRLAISTPEPEPEEDPSSPPPKRTVISAEKLTAAQDKEYILMPALIEVLEGELAALVLARVTDEGGKEYLRAEAPSCGTHVIENAKTLAPATWWGQYGKHLPLLSSVACKVLAQTVCASAAERNWSVYGAANTAARGRMGHAVGDKLVYCHEALHLKNKLQTASYTQSVEKWDSDSDSDATDDEADLVV